MVAAYTTQAMWDFWLALKSLEPASQLGGTFAAKSGYHNTRSGNQKSWPNDYSIRDAVDKLGPSDKAAALDWTFPDAQAGNYSTISKYCQRLMASSKDHEDPRLDGMREWYGQTDSDREVEGWDTRYYRPATSDSSHLWHIHFSFTRRDVDNSQIYADILSVLMGETLAQWRGDTQEDDMPFAIERPLNIDGTATVITIPPVQGGAAGWGSCWASLGCDGADLTVRGVYQKDGDAGWTPLFGGSWDEKDTHRTIKPAQPRADNSFGISKGGGKVKVTVTKVGAYSDLKEVGGSILIEYGSK